MPPIMAFQRGRMRLIVNLIAISFTGGAKPRVEIRGDSLGFHHANVAGETRIERKGKLLCGNSGEGVKVRDLPERVHPGIRPACPGHGCGRACQSLQRFFEYLLYGGRVDLALPTRIGCAVIRNRQGDPPQAIHVRSKKTKTPMTATNRAAYASSAE